MLGKSEMDFGEVWRRGRRCLRGKWTLEVLRRRGQSNRMIIEGNHPAAVTLPQV